ncbi:ICOS ligand-like isoform X3 [Chiloscyllium punctatum]|uniref:ICOS ligand-like isoform X3 n=1 Tax=Chiloscyllium punctatum TaxID=137246 RepID=UPI003B63676B
MSRNHWVPSHMRCTLISLKGGAFGGESPELGISFFGFRRKLPHSKRCHNAGFKSQRQDLRNSSLHSVWAVFRMKNWLFKLLFLVSSITVAGTVTPSVLGMVGEQVTLPCHYEVDGSWGVSDLRLLWQTENNQVVHAQYGRTEANWVQESRYRNRTSLAVTQFRHGDLSLQLQPVVPTDGGGYQCIVLKQGPQGFRKVKSTHVQLTTAANYSVPVISEAGPGEFRVGEEVNLTCSSSGGYPEPDVYWIGRDGHLLPEHRHVQTISSDPGSGLCQVTSLLRVTANGNVSLRCVVINRSTGDRKISAPWKFSMNSVPPRGISTVTIAAVIIGLFGVLTLGSVIYLRKRSHHNYRVARISDEFRDPSFPVTMSNVAGNSDVAPDPSLLEALSHDTEKIDIQHDSV